MLKRAIRLALRFAQRLQRGQDAGQAVLLRATAFELGF
jgi:hypothetical protein